MAAVRRDPGGQRLEVAQRGRRVGVARAPRAAAGRASGVSRASSGGEPGHRVEQRPVEELLVQPAHLAACRCHSLVELRDRVACAARASGRAGAASASSSGTTWVRRSW